MEPAGTPVEKLIEKALRGVSRDIAEVEAQLPGHRNPDGSLMAKRLQLGDIAVDVALKNIKNLRLSVHPPLGQVRISAPRRMGLDAIRAFAVAKLDWIRRQQRKLREQEREIPCDYLDHESHCVWGRRYPLAVMERQAAPTVELEPQRLVLYVRPGTGAEGRGAIVADWYRQQLRAAARPLIDGWEPLLGVRVRAISVRHMKTRWGSCTPKTGRIRLNVDLVKKPRECLEYVVVHEMTHLLEPTHNARFIALMDRFLPRWRHSRKLLNQPPVRDGPQPR